MIIVMIIKSLLFPNSSWKKELPLEEVLQVILWESLEMMRCEFWCSFKDNRAVGRVAEYDRMPS